MLSTKQNTTSSGYQDIGEKSCAKGVREYTEKIVSHIPVLRPDIEVVKLNVQEDHVHLVVVTPPRIAVADAIQYIKTQSVMA